MPLRSATRSVRRNVAVVIALVCAAATAGGCTSDDDAQQPTTTSSPSPTAARPAGARLPGLVPDLVARTEPSVVTIRTGQGAGSGVVYRENGVIVTNHHVVADNRTVQVEFANGSRSPGQVVATDQITDLAVVRTERDGLRPLSFANKLPRRGEFVIAMGSPLGFENSVTVGVVSGLDREIPGSAQQSRALVNLIQTDAAISPGNSGGALMNTDGRLVGINQSYLPPQTGAVSLGFAIPAPTVKDTVDELLQDGEASHAFLGIGGRSLSPQLTEALGIDAQRGVVVTRVIQNSPAAEAGLQRADVITRVGKDRVSTVENLFGALRELEPGQTVEVRLLREGEPMTVEVTVSDIPG